MQTKKQELKPYSPEFWRAAQAEVDQEVHRCAICFRARGEVVNVRRNGLAHGSDASVRRVEVRLVLIDGKPRYACLRCVPAPQEPTEDKTLIRKLNLSLFGDE